ncbi:MAG: hypothetical protein ACTS73_09525 [Arsenophonus sp. NEOnobi-MAG3]
MDNNIERLADDHENAKFLAMSLAGHSHIEINPEDIQTNIVIFQLYGTSCTAYELVNDLIKKGIRLLALNDKKVRAIVHQGINQHDIYTVSSAIQHFLDKHG